MAVRRLAPQDQQPASFAFSAAGAAFVAEQIAKYPAGRQASAVIPLLWKAQEENGGWVSQKAIEEVARLLCMPVIRVLEVATFYSMFNLAPVGRHFVQLCGTTPCALRGAEAIKQVCREKIGAPGHVSADGLFSWIEVECLGACCNAPMVQIGYDYYEDLTPETFATLLDDLAAGRPVRTGSQIGRSCSEPEGGGATLADSTLYDGSQIGAWRKRFEETAAPAAPAPAPAAPAPVPAPVARVEPVAPAAAPPPVALIADEHKPVLLLGPRDDRADDLKLIWGVGPKLEAMLHRMGVFHFDQIAGWTAMNLAWVDQNLEGFKGRAQRDDWIGQAKKLATGWRPESAAGDKPKSM